MQHVHAGEACADDDAAPKTTEVDTKRIERAVREILSAVGEDPNREGLRETPALAPAPSQEAAPPGRAHTHHAEQGEPVDLQYRGGSMSRAAEEDE